MSEDGLENFTNVMTALAAIGGVVAAWVGLFTWKRQALWNADSGIGKSILILLFRHNDALKGVRNGIIFTGEIAEATKGQVLPEDPRARRHNELSSVYVERWRRVQDVRAELYPLIIEGQALWGNDFKDRFLGLWRLEMELKNTVRLYLDAMNPNHDDNDRDDIDQIRKTRRAILYLSDESDDEFISDYNKELQPIEDYLRHKLGRKK